MTENNAADPAAAFVEKKPTITLGGKEYPIGEFTLGDQERMQPLFLALSDDTLAGSAARTTLIWIALKADDPVKWQTVEIVRSLRRVKFPEIMAAVKVVCKESGLAWAEAPAPGEAKPGTEPAAIPSTSGTGPSDSQS
jgi:hypothetical protein